MPLDPMLVIQLPAHGAKWTEPREAEGVSYGHLAGVCKNGQYLVVFLSAGARKFEWSTPKEYPVKPIAQERT